MAASTVPFRLDDAAREARLREFNQRAEILWFGFRGAFETPGLAVVTLALLCRGLGSKNHGIARAHSQQPSLQSKLKRATRLATNRR